MDCKSLYIKCAILLRLAFWGLLLFFCNPLFAGSAEELKNSMLQSLPSTDHYMVEDLANTAWMGFSKPTLLIEIASEKGYGPVVKYLVDYGVQPTGDSLCLAAQEGHKEVVSILLESGVNINAHGGAYGETPLMLAAAKGHLQIVEFLLEHGADPNERDNYNGLTAIDIVNSNDLDKNVKKSLVEAIRGRGGKTSTELRAMTK